MKLSDTNTGKYTRHRQKISVQQKGELTLTSFLRLCQIQSLRNQLQFEKANHPSDDKLGLIIAADPLITKKAVLKLQIHEASAKQAVLKGEVRVLNMCK